MKKNIGLILFFILLFPIVLRAQVPTQAEMDKMMKEAKDMLKKFTGDSSANQKLKELEKNEKQFNSIIKNNPAATDRVANKPGTFPSKQTKLLEAIPKKTFTKATVKSYLEQVYINLKKNIALEYIRSSEKIISQLKNNPELIMEAAITGAHINAMEEAVLLSAYAASVLPEPSLLNNCAAIFTKAGLEPAAIPILKSLLPAYADNTTVLNNLGQAYAGLGEKDSAMFFIGRCIKIDPNDAAASYCGGVIENSKGNTKKAKENATNSLKENYNPDASRLVKFIDPEFKLNRFVKPQIKLPEYFNIYKYLPFPAACKTIADVPRAKADYKTYMEMLDAEIKKNRKTGERI